MSLKIVARESLESGSLATILFEEVAQNKE
jgi:hypothetical protein